MAAQTIQPETPVRTLLTADRCDSCGAEAFVKATLPSGFGLLFCGHDYTKNEAALVSGGAAILDERQFIPA